MIFLKKLNSIRISPLFLVISFFFILVLVITQFFGFITAFLSITLLLFIIQLFLYSIVYPQGMIFLAVTGCYLGVWGALFPEEKFPITIFQVFLILTIISFFLHIISSGKLFINFHRSHLFAIIFITFLIFSSFYSSDGGNALFLSVTLLILLIFSIIVSNIFYDLLHFRILFHLVLFISGVLAFYSIYIFILNPENVLMNYLAGELKVFGRQAGTIGDPNQFGILLVFPLLFLSTEIFISTKNLKELISEKILYLILFILLFSALLVTYSRSSWLAFLFSFIIIFFLHKKIRRFLSLSLIGLCLLLFLGFGTLFFETILNRILSITDVSLNISNTTRIILAKAGLDMFSDSVIFGNGYRSFRILVPYYCDISKTMGIVDNHNIIIEILADLGIVGFILFLLVNISFVKAGFRSFKKVDEKLKPYLTTFIAYLFALYTFYQFYGGGLHDNLMWVCFGGILAINKISLQKYRDSIEPQK